MIRNIIGTTLILISYVIMGINWFYLMPKGLEVMPYWGWIVFVGALFGGFIKYCKPNEKNENMENGKLGKVSKAIDNFLDAITGDFNKEDEVGKNNKSKK